MKIDEVELAVPEGYQLILGQSHFIKTVEDLYETLASSMPGAKFGIAFCESSGKALIRYDGTDAESVKVAKEFARRLSAGHAPRRPPRGGSRMYRAIDAVIIRAPAVDPGPGSWPDR